MRVKEFERLLPLTGVWSAADIDQRTRRLRELQLLPVGGRGLNAPQMSAKHAAYILLSLAGALSHVQTTVAVMTFPNFRAVDSRIVAPTLLEVLENILSVPAEAEKVAEFRVIHGILPEVAITYRDGERVVFRDPELKNYDLVEEPWVTTDCVLYGKLFEHIALAERRSPFQRDGE